MLLFLFLTRRRRVMLGGGSGAFDLKEEKGEGLS
jgi:hypothetical protein